MGYGNRGRGSGGGKKLPVLTPSGAFNGTAGSGFAGSLPVDPVRTTAKPAVRLLVPDYQHFTFNKTVGVIALANDNGSMFNTFGIERVTFHYEGASLEVTEPRWQSIPTEAGTRTYFGWWVDLRKLVGVNGTGHLYVTATPRDATMQERVIGPYLFTASDDLFDVELEIAPSQPVIAGQRYQTLLAAGSYAKAQGAQNPLLSISEAGIYDIGDDGGTNAWAQTGRCNITASVPGVTIGKAAFDVSDATLNPNRMKLHLFGDITLDRANVSRIATAASGGYNHWFDGITITDRNGKDGLFDGGVRNPVGMFQNNPWFTECTVSEVYSALGGANLVRGCTGSNLGVDIVSQSLCVVQSTFRDHDDTTWNTDIPAFTVQYSGAESTATLARSGGTEGNGGGVYTASIGATDYTFNVGNAGNSSADIGGSIDGWLFGDVVNWLNTLPDVNATLLITPDRRANTGGLPGELGFGFDGQSGRSAPVDIKTAPVTVQSYTNKHGDWYQHEAGDLDNVIAAFNSLANAQVQCVFLSPSGGGNIRDVFFVGNVFDTEQSPDPDPNFDHSVAATQIGRGAESVNASHVVLAHNTFANQRVLVSNSGGGLSVDGYCLVSNMVAPVFAYTGSALADWTVTNLHLFDGATPPGLASNVAIGGDKASLFADATGGNYAAAGALLDNGFAPVIPFDLLRQGFPDFAALGALAASAPEYVAPTGPDLATQAANALTGKGSSALWLPQAESDLYAEAARTTPVTAGSGSAVGSVTDYSGNGHHLEASGTARPAATTGLTFDNSDDKVNTSAGIGSSNIDVIAVVRGTDATGIFGGDSGSTRFFGTWNTGSTNNPTLSSGSPVYEVDGVAVSPTQQGAIHAALMDGIAHTYVCNGVDMSSYTSPHFGRHQNYGAPIGCEIAMLAMVDMTVATTGDLDAVIALANEVRDGL